tara:strand:+ start:64 stop:273 length:210 start_codon:yes stop_codon:yes gene_type:complete
MDKNHYELAKFCKEIIKKSKGKKLSEDEEWFEDDPRALKEVEYGKVIKRSTGIVYTESHMAEIIIDTKK